MTTYNDWRCVYSGIDKKSGPKAQKREGFIMAERKWKDVDRRPVFRFTDGKDKTTGEVIKADGLEFVGVFEKRMPYKDPTTGKDKMRYNVKDEAGKIWLIFGTTRLDRKLEDVADGSVIKIIYKGESKTTKNGRAHDFDVQIAEA
jgi:hypothetical protein